MLRAISKLNTNFSRGKATPKILLAIVGASRPAQALKFTVIGKSSIVENFMGFFGGGTNWINHLGFYGLEEKSRAYNLSYFHSTQDLRGRLTISNFHSEELALSSQRKPLGTAPPAGEPSDCYGRSRTLPRRGGYKLEPAG
ncbi:hypothetical protein KEM48_002915 [Puccinia striiformis f. sp. tritici PST-130]|uniref:Uncharacterized protein n=1 Tax=Puccinia striiformis f. sp. tritici PST-78 TaxID=1165861 RepID=A0A0L0V0L0_9BASI|nr:hypothetical protein H4Q26_003099 [Puccinia striiformis f. sp. tritici PST-130]KAI9609208.1 hypothetical protein KEM48_002915 [Puccinia striiformis f. sp. tritici PST-130]KNE92820.1 hypothetical protein PSTG_13802 [Puccinia striiformis f. sp. tritici PST-78]